MRSQRTWCKNQAFDGVLETVLLGNAKLAGLAAIEECLCNAFYHRAYDIREPVEVRILPDRLTIGSFPGPDRSISDDDLKAFRFLSRRYRNRRIGQFLKELDMTEGRGTGIPKVLHAIRTNGSPDPIFHTDPDRTYFLAEFPLHPAFEGEATTTDEEQVGEQVGEQVRAVLRYLAQGPMSGLWRLIPRNGQARPTVAGKPVPLLDSGQYAAIPSQWIAEVAAERQQ